MFGDHTLRGRIGRILMLTVLFLLIGMLAAVARNSSWEYAGGVVIGFVAIGLAADRSGARLYWENVALPWWLSVIVILVGFSCLTLAGIAMTMSVKWMPASLNGFIAAASAATSIFLTPGACLNLLILAEQWSERKQPK